MATFYKIGMLRFECRQLGYKYYYMKGAGHGFNEEWYVPSFLGCFILTIMNDFKKYLVSNGFSEQRKNAFVLYLTNDVFIEITLDEATWKKYGDVEFHLYVYSHVFGLLMTELFKDQESIAWKYIARKLRKDTRGCLAMACVSVDIDAKNFEESKLSSSNILVSLKKFIDDINYVKNSDRLIRKAFYEGVLDSLVFPIETVWVYLFFAAKLKLSELETLNLVQSSSIDKKNKRTWNLHQEIDLEIIDLFFKIYQKSEKIKSN